MQNLIFFGVVAAIALVTLVVLGVVLTRLYQRASKEQAFVRTGAGGQKVVKDGGALVLPVFHEIIPINMQTLCLSVLRRDKDALITKDRLRVNVQAEFYVRVKPDEESIATAAQTLGRRTLDPRELSALVEGKFVDALRAVGASMELNELHEKRNHFVQEVQNTVAADLTKNGLELESVSLTALDQTSAEYFNPQNAFDAEGLAKLTRITEERRKERNDIETTTRVAIEQKNFETNKTSLKIKQDSEFAALETEREIETRRAEQKAQLATQQAERSREAEVARITAEKATETAEVEKDQAVKAAGITSAQKLKEAEIASAQATELAEQARRVAVAKKSEEQSKAQAEADAARAEAVRAAEAVKTVEATAAAERAKEVAIIAAREKAEQEAVGIKVRADAEFAAAESQAKAKERLAEASAKTYEVDAAGQRALNEASNTLSTEQVAASLKQALIAQLPAIMEQLAKPMEAVEGIRIVQLNGGGIGSGSNSVAGEGGASSGGLPEQLTKSLLDYRLQVPFVDQAISELGLNLKGGLNGVANSAIGNVLSGGALEAEVADEAPVGGSAEERAELQRLAGISPSKSNARKG